MKTITWVTPISFIDVDILVVPKLSGKFRIHWIILGSRKPAIFTDLEKKSSKYLFVEFYEMRYKWYSPLHYFAFRKFVHYIIDKQSDIIYIDKAPQLFEYYASAALLPKDKTVFATHNVKTPRGARLEFLARFYMKKLLDNFQNFQVFSLNQRDYLESMVRGKNVLYAPLALKEYGKKCERTSNPDIVNFLSFGHIRHYKRIDLLIDAAQMLYEETQQRFVVTIAGKCSSWERYSDRVKYPELFNLYIGFVDDNDVADIFSNADYLVLPYQDLAQSGAITVAFNYGVPVITSNILPFQEFVEEGVNGFMFQTESANSLKEVMNRCLIMKKEEYYSLQESTKKFVREHYSLEAIAQKYIEYFNKM